MTQPDPTPQPYGPPTHLGRPVPPKKKSKLPWVLGGVAVAAVLCCGGGAIISASQDGAKKPAAEEQTTTAAAPTTTQAAPPVPATTQAAPTKAVTTKPAPPPPPPAPTIEDGNWVVGEDFPAGKYRVVEPITQMCYWSITKAGSNGGDIIANGLPEGGRPSVTLKKGQEFETSCGTWKKVG